MKNSEVQRGNLQVPPKVETVDEPVRVPDVTVQAEPLVTEGDHVVGIQGLDESRNVSGPIEDDVGAAKRATSLVGQLPRENGSRVAVAAHDGLDVLPVLLLSTAALVKSDTAEDPRVSPHAAIVVPVVYERNDQLHAARLGRLDNVVKPLEAVGSRVNDAARGRQVLVPHGILTRNRVDVVEAPSHGGL